MSLLYFLLNFDHSSSKICGERSHIMQRQSAKKQTSNERTANSLVAEIAGQMYPKQENTGDIKFIVVGEVIWAHKCVLAALSPKYEA